MKGLVMKANLQDIRNTLEAKLSEARTNLRRRDSIQIEQVADPLDMTKQMEDREIETANLDRNAILVRQITAALKRIGDGTYGACLDCDEPISPRRLAVIPWAELCVHCQEKADNAQVRDLFYPAAA